MAGTGGALDEWRGAFVSIHRGAELRGCLGNVEPRRRLAETVADLAAAVADSDPRFAPVSIDEVPQLRLEISVLTPERLISDVEEIVVGQHGLVVEQEGRRGLLLPQVAVEHGWDRVALLANTCLKAGVDRDAWRRGARILVFEAEVFGEPAADSTGG